MKATNREQAYLLLMAECYRKWYQHAKVLLLQNLKYVTLASKSSSKEIVAGHSKNSD